MDVVSMGPLRAASLVWQSRPGAWTQTIVCKATYLLLPSESQLAESQDDPHETDLYWDDDERSSLRAASDLAPFKARGDVLVVGHAYAPKKQPVASLMTRIMVGEIDKSIEVHCDRSWAQDGQLREGQRFVKMSLRWERAAGGPDTANPPGVRLDGPPDRYGSVALPNLQAPGRYVTSPRDHIDPVGYGPIAPKWPLRIGKLYRYAGSWPYPGCWQQPFPEGIDPGYFNAAPLDQQIESLQPNERIILENLHPEHARLVTRLPDATTQPRAVVERASSYGEPVQLRVDTLVIDTDRGVCTLTWRGRITLEHPNQPGRVTITLPGASTPQRAQVSADLDAHRHGSRTMDASALEQLRAALPFAGGPPQAPPSSPGAFDPNQSAVLPFRGNPGAPPPSWSPQGTATPPGGLPALRQGPPPPSLSFGAPPPSTPEPPSVVPPSVVAPPPIIAPPPGIVAPPGMIPPQSGLAPPPMVRAQASTDPVAPPVSSSPWTGGEMRPKAGLSVGQLATAPNEAAPAAKDAALEGAAMASNAAAGATAAPAPRPETPLPRIQPAAAEAKPAARAEPRELLQLVWFDEDFMPRIRRKPSWRSILEALEDAPPDPETDDPTLAKNPAEIEDRRDVSAILAKADAIEPEGLNEAIFAGVRDDGTFVPRLLLVAGELFFPFDELEMLKATVTTVSPIVGNDENLKATVETAERFLRGHDLRSAPGVAEGLTTRIRDAFAQGRRAVPANYLDTQTERVLLEQRAYQKRTVLGATHLRALLQSPGAKEAAPAYIPEAVAKKLPLFQRFRAKLIADIHLAVDQYETHPSALKVATLARLAPAPKR